METEELREKRRNANIQRDHTGTEESKITYRELDRKVKTNAEKDWKNCIDGQGTELEVAANKKNQ